MELLQSQLSLRSLDVVNGRSSGTGRPSHSSLGGVEGQAQALSPFADWLQRGLGAADEAGRAPFRELTQRGVEDEVARRIHTQGDRAIERDSERGRAGDSTESRSAEGDQRARNDATSRRGEGEDRAREPRSSSEDRQDPSDASPASQATRPRSEERASDGNQLGGVEARGRNLAASDPSAAEGAEGASGGLDSAAAPLSASTNGLAHGNAPNTTAAFAAAAAHIAPAQVAVGAASPSSTSTSAVAVGATSSSSSPSRADRAGEAAASEAPSAGPTAEEIELAESVMRQLRARIQIGQREAVIELRPRELGRIDVHLRFEDGVLHARMRAERPETLAVLEAHGPELRAWLARDGAEVRDLDFALASESTPFPRPDAESRGQQRGLGRNGRRAAELRVGEANSPNAHTRSAAASGAARPNTGGSQGIDLVA